VVQGGASAPTQYREIGARATQASPPNSTPLPPLRDIAKPGSGQCKRPNAISRNRGQGDASIPTQHREIGARATQASPPNSTPLPPLRDLMILHECFEYRVPIVKKTCLLVSLYIIRSRESPVTHGSNQQSPL